MTLLALGAAVTALVVTAVALAHLLQDEWACRRVRELLSQHPDWVDQLTLAWLMPERRILVLRHEPLMDQVEPPRKRPQDQSWAGVLCQFWLHPSGEFLVREATLLDGTVRWTYDRIEYQEPARRAPETRGQPRVWGADRVLYLYRLDRPVPPPLARALLRWWQRRAQ